MRALVPTPTSGGSAGTLTDSSKLVGDSYALRGGTRSAPRVGPGIGSARRAGGRLLPRRLGPVLGERLGPLSFVRDEVDPVRPDADRVLVDGLAEVLESHRERGQRLGHRPERLADALGRLRHLGMRDRDLARDLLRHGLQALAPLADAFDLALHLVPGPLQAEQVLLGGASRAGHDPAYRLLRCLEHRAELARVGRGRRRLLEPGPEAGLGRVGDPDPLAEGGDLAPRLAYLRFQARRPRLGVP